MVLKMKEDRTRLDDYRENIPYKIAMLVTLVSFSMLFGTLFLAYTILRYSSDAWPPVGMEKISLFRPTISTVLILLSSLVFFAIQKNYQFSEKISLKIKAGLYLTVVLGIGFLLSQVNFWAYLKSEGYYVESGVFSSIIHAFTWIHSAHILMGEVLLCWLLFSIIKSPSVNILKVRFKNVGLFWHFLGIIWCIMYITLFVI
jgi:cytochrome c oxidase subunit III